MGSATTHTLPAAAIKGNGSGRLGVPMSAFAEDITLSKYAHTKASGHKETWPEIAHRQAYHVVRPYLPNLEARIRARIEARQLIPGGRYLYAAGRRYHAISNCYMYDVEDSKEDWGRLMKDITVSLMSGGGIGVVYSKLRGEGADVEGMGGKSTGPLALMRMVNEAARYIIQGGSRRCLPEGTLVHCHRGLVPIEDVVPGDYALTADGYHEVTANLSQGVQQTVRVLTQTGELECTPNHRVAVLAKTDGEYYWEEAQNLEEGDRLLFIPQTLPGRPTTLPGYNHPYNKHSSTCKNITIPRLDADMAWMLGFLHGNGYVHVATDEGKGHVSLTVSHTNEEARDKAVRTLSRFGTAVSVRQGDGACWTVHTESRQLACYFAEHFKRPHESINVPECVLTGLPEIRAAYIAGVMDADGCVHNRPVCVASSVYPDFLRQLQSVVASLGIPTRVKLNRPAQGKWQALYCLNVVAPIQLCRFAELVGPHSTKKEALVESVSAKQTPQFSYTIPTGYMLRERKWQTVVRWHKNRDAAVTLETWQKAHGETGYVPVTVKGVVPGRKITTYDIEVEERNEFVAAGGMLVHNSAIWAGLHWNHPDVFKFIHIKKWSPLIHQCRREDFTFPAPMDMTNVSVILDTAFFTAFRDPAHPKHGLARTVYRESVRSMVETGEPGFSVDTGEKDSENLRNACTELCTDTNRDMCNLLSLNLSRIPTLEDFRDCVELGTAFLVCGTLYGMLPIPEMYAVREKTRRLGLGLMGVHEWLLQRGRRYGPDDELGRWMDVYTMSTEDAHRYADKLSVSRPVATRAIAPTGTISIVGETTSGIEPVFATAYKRRYLKGQEWCAQYVVDATARKMVEMGMNPMRIETALDLAEDTDRRVGFQAWMQEKVDHGISSTLNIPEWGSSINNESTVDKFGNDLMKHLPNVRGMTAYPNGARGGQPLVATPYWDAIHRVGVEFKDHSEETCKSGVCGS